MTADSYPLTWPASVPRTPSPLRTGGAFKVTLGASLDQLEEALRKFSAKDIVISTNFRPRIDGRPYADQVGKRLDDPGVSVWFIRKGRPAVIACDRYYLVESNVRAVCLTIEALRGIQRWGSSEIAEQAFSGFLCLPAPGEKPKRPWRDVLGFGPDEIPNTGAILGRHKALARERHPDVGGSDEAMAELNRACDEGVAELKIEEEL